MKPEYFKYFCCISYYDLEKKRPEKQYRNLENWFRPLKVIFHKNSIIEIKEINQQTLKTRDNVSRIFHWDIYYRYLYRKKYTYIYIVPIRFRTVFSKYFLTLISHDFHPWGWNWLLKIYSTGTREKGSGE